MKPKSLGTAYQKGWNQKDKKRGEFYLTILNDLAEDLDIPGRHTRSNLAECLGWMQREHQHMIEHMNSVQGDLLLLAAKSLMSQKEKGLFAKPESKSSPAA